MMMTAITTTSTQFFIVMLLPPKTTPSMGTKLFAYFFAVGGNRPLRRRYMAAVL